MPSPSGSRSLFISVVVIIIFLFSVLPATYADLAGDRSALLLLRSSIVGNTLRWNQSDESDPCAWEGIHCSNNFMSPRRVVEVRLPGDGLSGQIPTGSIGNLTHLRVLSLRENSLSGEIPSDIGLCTQLRTITLRGNQFSGQIPAASLFSLTNLISLDFSGNNLLGEIPSSFNNLIQLQSMYLENNQLNGVIPNLSSLSQLRNFNVSNNRLDGTIPLSLTGFPSDSFMGNSLCGTPLKACSSNSSTDNGGMKNLSGGAIAGIVIGSVCGVIVVLSVLFIAWRRKLSIENSEPREKSSSAANLVPVEGVKQQQQLQLGGTNNSIISELEEGNTVNLVRIIRTGKGNTVGSDQSSDDDGLIFFKDAGDRIGAHEVKSFKLQELLMAAAQVIGKGRFGTTYRAYVVVGGDDDERKEKKNVIVIRLKDVCVNNNVGEREFRERVEAMGRLKHENLVPLLAYFYGKNERLLVYDDLGSRGAASLASLLHDDSLSLSRSRSPTLTWEIRRKVILEIAKAIEYLHSSDPYFSHGNINSSSVLLLLPVQTSQNNNKFIMSSASATSYLSEFGISSLISSCSSSSNNGYWAPEVVDSRRTTQKADVYSFGVLILELLTGKDPRGGDLVRWVHDTAVVKGKYCWSIHQMFDQELQVQQPSHGHGYALINNYSQQQKMVQLLQLGISCTTTHPDKRPSIFQVRELINTPHDLYFLNNSIPFF